MYDHLSVQKCIAAVFSDIHSNYHAFKACYYDAVKCGADCFIFLGDYVSDLADPQKTMDLVYEIQTRYPTFCLRGNRERYMLDCEKGISSFSRGSKTGSLLYTYEKLRQRDLEFFKGLKISDTIDINGVSFEVAHASMNDDRFYFEGNDSRIESVFVQMKCGYFLTGHSHRQYIESKSDKTIINPGSVGIPQGGVQWPQYALLEIADGEVSCRFRQVTYDLSDAIRAQFENGLVDYAKYWAVGILYDIITGEERVLKLLELVQKEGNAYNEEDWRTAADEMGMKLTQQEIMKFYNAYFPAIGR